MNQREIESAVSSAMGSLDRAGVRFCLRSGRSEFENWQPGGDIDILTRGQDLPRARKALTAMGWAVVEDRGHRGHTFASMMVRGEWLKLDLVSVLRYGSSAFEVAGAIDRRVWESGYWTASPSDQQLHRRRRAELGREAPTWWERFHRRLPGGGARGVIVAFMGPDGVGKSTIIREVAGRIPVAVESSYAGTGKRGQPPKSAPVSVSVGASLRESAFLLRKALPAWRSVVRMQIAARRGSVVLVDRHPYDTLCSRPNRTPWGRRIELFLMTKAVPPPDLFVLLDAPTPVILARKDELDEPTAERLRQDYRSGLAGFHTETVRTDQPLHASASEVLSLVHREYAAVRSGAADRASASADAA